MSYPARAEGLGKYGHDFIEPKPYKEEEEEEEEDVSSSPIWINIHRSTQPFETHEYMIT